MMTPTDRQWSFSKEEFKRTPSTQAGHDVERERIERMKGCDFIFKVGAQLRLPQTTISTACVFLHRFYMRFSLKEFHYYDIAATSLFLATKCEETGRKLSDIVKYCAQTALKDPTAIIDEQSKDYWRWRDTILYNEELLLEALCFDLTVQHPYSGLKQYWKKFSGQDKALKVAWTCVNDTYRSTTCLSHDGDTIAAACLFYASTFCGQPLKKEIGQEWYEYLDVGLSAVIQVVTSMIELYKSAPQLLKDALDPKVLCETGIKSLSLLQEIASAKTVTSPTMETLNESSGTRVMDAGTTNHVAVNTPTPSGARSSDTRKVGPSEANQENLQDPDISNGQPHDLEVSNASELKAEDGDKINGRPEEETEKEVKEVSDDRLNGNPSKIPEKEPKESESKSKEPKEENLHKETLQNGTVATKPKGKRQKAPIITDRRRSKRLKVDDSVSDNGITDEPVKEAT